MIGVKSEKTFSDHCSGPMRIASSKADDIRDFQVEGITVGESLLNF